MRKYKAIVTGLLALLLLGCAGRQEAPKPRTAHDWAGYIRQGGNIRDVPMELRTKEVIKAYFDSAEGKLSAGAMMSVVEGLPDFDYDTARYAVSVKPTLVGYLPGGLRTPEIYRLAFGKDPLVAYRLCCDPYYKAKWDSDMAAASIDASPESLIWIPREFVTKAMLGRLIGLGLLKNLAGEGRFEELRQAEAWDQSLAISAFQLDWRLYALIPEKYCSYAMSKAAVSKDGKLLRLVPREQKFANNGELCRIALRQTAAAYVPDYFKFRFEP